VRRYLNEEPFCFTYGDGLSDVDVGAVIAHHQASGALATMTTVQPPGRFGAYGSTSRRSLRSTKKPEGDGAWINGGYFVLSPGVFDYIDGDDTVWNANRSSASPPTASCRPSCTAASGNRWTRCATRRCSRSPGPAAAPVEGLGLVDERRPLISVSSRTSTTSSTSPRRSTARSRNPTPTSKSSSRTTVRPMGVGAPEQPIRRRSARAPLSERDEHRMARNFDRLLELARGRYVMCLSSDDFLFPPHLEQLEAGFARDPQLDVVYCGRTSHTRMYGLHDARDAGPVSGRFRRCAR